MGKDWQLLAQKLHIERYELHRRAAHVPLFKLRRAESCSLGYYRVITEEERRARCLLFKRPAASAVIFIPSHNRPSDAQRTADFIID